MTTCYMYISGHDPTHVTILKKSYIERGTAWLVYQPNIDTPQCTLRCV